MTDERKKAQAFEMFFKENYSLFYFTAYHLLDDEELSRDIVGDSIRLVWENHRSEDAHEWKSYMYRIVRSKCIDHLRHESVKRKYVEFYKAVTTEAPEDNEAEEERIQYLYRQIEQLPELPRQVLELCYFQKKRYSEVAELLNISPSYVKKLIMTALRQLREAAKHHT